MRRESRIGWIEWVDQTTSECTVAVDVADFHNLDVADSLTVASKDLMWMGHQMLALDSHHQLIATITENRIKKQCSLLDRRRVRPGMPVWVSERDLNLI